jgi:hypothetical protein
MNALRITALLAVASTLSACTYATSEPFGGDPATAETGAALARPKDPCPASAPRPDSACGTASLLCSYGSDPRFGCRDVLSCNSGKWASVGDTCSKVVPTCPRAALRSDGGLDACTGAELGLTCVYADEAYTCAPCEGNLCRAESYWQTQSLPTACPASVPNFGQACTSPGARCNYNTCANDGAANYGAAMTCTTGFWAATTGTICL